MATTASVLGMGRACQTTADRAAFHRFLQAVQGLMLSAGQTFTAAELDAQDAAAAKDQQAAIDASIERAKQKESK